MISLTHTLALSSVTGQKNKWKFNAKCEKEEKKNNDDNNNIGKNLKTKKSVSNEKDGFFFNEIIFKLKPMFSLHLEKKIYYVNM